VVGKTGRERPLGALVRRDRPAPGTPADVDGARAVPSFGQLWNAVRAALDDLYDRDIDLLGTTERAVVGRLMVYLDKHLAGLSRGGLVIDQDYEHAGQATKRLAATGLPDKKVVPDLVFHRRGDPGPTGNVLAIEVKTNSRADGRLHDFAKLSVLTGHVTGAIVYDKCLRLHSGPALPQQARKGEVRLLPDMSPYRYGIWLLLETSGAECWWWSERKGHQPLQYSDQPPDHVSSSN
jgi:hypothetical protein